MKKNHKNEITTANSGFAGLGIRFNLKLVLYLNCKLTGKKNLNLVPKPEQSRGRVSVRKDTKE
jgi:hypothetical protein